MSSRLFTEVRERRGLAYYIYGHNMGYTDTGTLYAQGGVDIQRIDDAVSTVVNEFARMAAEPVEADELEKARNFSKGRLILSLEDPKGMIMFGLRNEVLEGKIREPDEVLAGLDAVTLEDIQRVAQDIILEDRLNLAAIGPFDDPDRFQKLLALSA
jgi:predicted Zn-dependent peptidase